MIIVDDILISDEIVEEQFVCDLNSCKGGCCEDGDAGAPLTYEETKILDEQYDVIQPYMTETGKRAVKKHGKYTVDDEFGYVTTTINGGLCAYALKDEHQMIKCGIEQAYYDGKIAWKKPISCHLFPIRVSNSVFEPDLEMLNYEPREEAHLCKAACQLGKKLKVPVYQFLKEPIIRKYGEDFYDALDATASELNNTK